MTGSGTAVGIVYDAFGSRVSKTVNVATTKYLVEDDADPIGLPQVFDELTGGVVTQTYTYRLRRIDEEQVVGNTWTRVKFQEQALPRTFALLERPLVELVQQLADGAGTAPHAAVRGHLLIGRIQIGLVAAGISRNPRHDLA